MFRPVLSASILLAVAAGAVNGQQIPRLTRVAEFGCVDCGGPTQFASILDVVVTDSGTVLVVNTDDPMLRMFDRSGRSLWTSGRAGTGPGEFRLPIRAAVGPRGIQVVDMSLRRLSRLDASGGFLQSAPITGFAASASSRGRTGELIILVDNFRGQFTLQRWTPADSGNVIGEVPKSEAARAGVLTIPSSAVSPNGEIAVLRDGNEYRILRLSPSGTALGEIVRDIPRLKRTPEEIEAVERRRKAAADRVASERGRTGGRGAPPIRPPSDEFKPHIAIDGLRFDDTGRLWVRTMRGNEHSTVFDLFRADGGYLGELTVPAAIGSFSLAGRWLATTAESDDGVPRIVIWEVR